MALKIYESANPDSALSINGTFLKPLFLTFDGINGGVLEKRLQVRNDDIGKTYSNITIQPIDGGDDLVNGNTGYSWQVSSGNQKPLTEQWDLQTLGNIIELSDINDTITYLPFWIRIVVPAGVSTASFRSIALRIVATEV